MSTIAIAGVAVLLYQQEKLTERGDVLKGDMRAAAQMTALIDRYMDKVERETAEQILGAEDEAILARFEARRRGGNGG